MSRARRFGWGFALALGTLPETSASARAGDVADVEARIAALVARGVDDATAWGEARASAPRCEGDEDPELHCELADAWLTLAATRVALARLAATAASLGVSPVASPAATDLGRRLASREREIEARLARASTVNRSTLQTLARVVHDLREATRRIDALEEALAARPAPAPATTPLELARAEARRVAAEAAAADEERQARRGRRR